MTARRTAAARTRDATPPPVSVEDIEHLAAIPLHSTTGPSLAGLLGVSRGHATRMVAAGRIPSRRLGGRIVVPVRALLSWLASGDNLMPDAVVERRQPAEQPQLTRAEIAARERVAHLPANVPPTAADVATLVAALDRLRGQR